MRFTTRAFTFSAPLALSLALLLVPALAADWPQFRGPRGSGASDTTGLPATWTATENMRWKAELPGRGVSSPIVAGGRVYVTACSGYLQDRLHVLAFDLKSGKKLWERQLWATGSTNCNNKTCMAAATPVADGERVYALFATGDLVCFDRDGDLLWYRALVKDYPTITNQVGMAASPVLANNILVVPMENAGESFLAGLDKLTGAGRWRVDRAKEINWTTPLVVTNGDRTEVIFQGGSDVTAFNAATGEKLWSHSAKGMATIPSPVPAGDLILAPGEETAALKPGRNQPTPEIVWQSPRLRSGYTTPVFHDGRVYAINTAGVLVCADAKDGEDVWKQRLKGPFSGSPVVADGKIFAVNEEGTTFVVRAGGAEPELLGTNPLGEPMLATPAIADGAILLRSDKHLFCVGKP